MRRRICVVTGSRAEYGLIRPTLWAIKNHQNLDLSLIVCGMHVSPDFGSTIEDIKADGFKIDALIKNIYPDDTGKSMAKSVGLLISELSELMANIKPHLLLALTDLGHALATAIVGVYTNIPVAHIHGGDVSGTVDESIRHAITKLSHIHFSATEKSADRIIKMGEDPWRVHVVGAPGLDSILNRQLPGRDEINRKYDIDISKKFILMIQHPDTTEVENAEKQIKETLDAIAETMYRTILIYPNADAGGRRMIKIIKEYVKKYPFINAFKNVPHPDYLSLMKHASLMVGNSSSGIIEAPSFHLPVVNIGSRQEGRERSDNVIDASYNSEDIKKAIEKALFDEDYIKKLKTVESPYGDGRAFERIVHLLNSIKIDKKLIQKRLTY
ncbi:MAG: UDP-N-acetylglucosamine 2-epimerase [Candidatus Hodarchaeales archaeon]